MSKRLDILRWLTAEELHTNPPTNPIRVHVGLPTYGWTPAICMLSFGMFIGNSVSEGLIAHIGQIDGAYLDRARNDLIRQAIANDSTHVMFVDQDVILPPITLKRLLSHNVDYVGGSYWGKDDFYTPVSFHLDPFHRIYELDECPKVASESDPIENASCWCGPEDVEGEHWKDHLHEVGGIGMGCTLLSVKMLKDMATYYDTVPCPCGSPNCTPERWFSTMETGEDIHLAMRAQDMGISRYLDGFVQAGHARTHLVARQNYEWASRNAPHCTIPNCTRVAFWDVSDADSAERAVRCFEHREER